MPCKDTTSRVTVLLDQEDCLVDFDFSKISCNKEISGGTGYLEYCKGKSIDEITRLEFQEPLEFLAPVSTEDQLFIYLEWDALRTSLAQYLGEVADIDQEKYQISSITSDEKGTTIVQVICPPEKMPDLISCKKRVP
ncbi:MAG: iron-sulfur cluster assembly scaffold protein [Nitrospinaceae bacterium]|nr:iron-sulfur cluster assembly scaffold protein [Nitrospinaceae bacterium]